MSKTTPFKLTREKHLDHMVKVVPFIALMFGIQGYILTRIHQGMGGAAVFILAGLLIAMITGFITYDVKHRVNFFDDYLEMSFLGLSKKISYSDIISVHVSEPKQTFATVVLRTRSSKHTFFFVDDADGIKAFLESRNLPELKAAA